MMKTIALAIAMSLACSAALAQQQSWTEQRYTPDGALVTTRSDGNMSETTMRREHDGTKTYTSTHTPGPQECRQPREAPPTAARRNGVWTGYQGSPRDKAWVEACKPRIVTDREGIDRYTYAKRGCEYGDALWDRSTGAGVPAPATWTR